MTLGILPAAARLYAKELHQFAMQQSKLLQAMQRNAYSTMFMQMTVIEALKQGEVQEAIACLNTSCEGLGEMLKGIRSPSPGPLPPIFETNDG